VSEKKEVFAVATTMTYGALIRASIAAARSVQESLWENFLTQSRAYQQALGLSNEELDMLEDLTERPAGIHLPTLQGMMGGDGRFLNNLEVGGEKFCLTVQSTCGCPYGGQWEKTITAICTSNPRLNDQHGQGTTLINLLPEEWHNQLVEYLRTHEVSVSDSSAS
jgi:hypothetical protein